jgi:hypothetical protein
MERLYKSYLVILFNSEFLIFNYFRLGLIVE